jgi:hypothetical protein
MDWHGLNLKVPTEAEILRIKAVLILKRNASRDYLDFAALSNHMGTERAVAALDSFDRLYPQQSGESALQQLLIQIASPMPFDLDKTGFSRYKGIVPQWKDWDSVFHFCSNFSVTAFRLICKP